MSIRTKVCAWLGILAALSLLAGCVSRLIDFTVISNKNVELRFKDTAKGPRVTGEDMVWSVLGILPLGTPSLEEACDRAIESAGAGYEALIDGVLYRIYNYYLLVSKEGYKVEGTPVKTKEILALAEQRGENMEKQFEKVMFHSSLGRDNSKAIEKIGIQVVEERKE
ncbi:MAG: hypothetical protein AB1798_14025 [Spirochaetota bacterium]